MYGHRRDTVETLQGIAAHQPLGGREVVILGLGILDDGTGKSGCKVTPCMGTWTCTRGTCTWAVQAPQCSTYCQCLGLGTIICLVLGV